MQRNEYDKLPGLNWSKLKHMATSPLAFVHNLNAPHKDSSAMLLGRAIHTLLLEPDQFALRHPVFTGGKARYGKAWDAFSAEFPGADALLASERDRVFSAADAVRRHPEASRLLGGNVSEQAVTWRDADTGVACKARVDSAGSRLVELKSTGGDNFHPRKFASHAASLLYHGQIAFYADGYQASTSAAFTEPPAVIVVQSDAPHDVAVYDVDWPFVEAGRRLYKSLLRRYVECERTGCWPGVCSDAPLTLSLPAWAQDEDAQEAFVAGAMAG